MEKKHYEKEMRDGESAMEVGGYSYKKQLARSLEGDHNMPCNENHDIRMDGVKTDPLCHSAAKEWDREMRPVDHPKVGSDVNLHADTTHPNENVLTGNYGEPLSSSASLEKSRELKNTDNRSAKKEKSFNS